MEFLSAALTLFFVMDPLGNIPLFAAVMRTLPAERRMRVILRECLIALAILLLACAFGRSFLVTLGISTEALRIGGGVVLFLIALRMVFPAGPENEGHETEEPFIVPLATPLVAGPSAIATVIVLTGSAGGSRMMPFAAITAAWFGSTLLLAAAPFFARVLRRRGLMALERLMGMLLVVVSVQMFLDGLHLPSGAK